MYPLTTSRPLHNAIPRIYSSSRRNDYVLEFEQFKRAFVNLRETFPDTPILEFQMSDWISHRLSMIALSISELQMRIDAGEEKARLKKEKKWVPIKGPKIDTRGLEIVGWRERYGQGWCWEYRTATDNGEEEEGEDGLPGLMEDLSVSEGTVGRRPFTPPSKEPQGAWGWGYERSEVKQREDGGSYNIFGEGGWIYGDEYGR